MIETLRIDDMNFEVRRSARRQTLGLTVDRGGELVVHAPKASPLEELERWTRKKMLWVHRKLALKENGTSETFKPEFVNGESFPYLGRHFRLKIVTKLDAPLHFDGKRFFLRDDARKEAFEHFRRWYINIGQNWLRERATMLSRKTGTTPAKIDVRDLGYRWGSCGKNSVLYFSWRVLQLPVRLVDYVVVHELVHLEESHHGPEFWHAVERALPDYAQRRDELRQKS